MLLWMAGICWEVKVKLNRAAADSKRRRRRIIQRTLDILESKMWTTTSLSDRERTWRHWEPPNIRGYHLREKFSIGNGLIYLWRGPGSTEPFSIKVSAKTQGACCIRSDFHVCGGRHPWKQPEAHTMLGKQKLMPPLYVQLEFWI